MLLDASLLEFLSADPQLWARMLRSSMALVNRPDCRVSATGVRKEVKNQINSSKRSKVHAQWRGDRPGSSEAPIQAQLGHVVVQVACLTRVCLICNKRICQVQFESVGSWPGRRSHTHEHGAAGLNDEG